MSRILSQDEIDALLARGRRAGADGERAARLRADGVVTYNFRRPDRVSKEQLRSLHFLHDRFARNVVDLAVGVPAHDDRGQHRLGRAVRLLRVPDVAARPDRVLRGGDAAARRRSARSRSTRRSPSRWSTACSAAPATTPGAEPRADRDRAERPRLGGQAAARAPDRDLAGDRRRATSASTAARRGRRCCRSRRPTRSSSCSASTCRSARRAAC